MKIIMTMIKKSTNGDIDGYKVMILKVVTTKTNSDITLLLYITLVVTK